MNFCIFFSYSALNLAKRNIKRFPIFENADSRFLTFHSGKVMEVEEFWLALRYYFLDFKFSKNFKLEKIRKFYLKNFNTQHFSAIQFLFENFGTFGSLWGMRLVLHEVSWGIFEYSPHRKIDENSNFLRTFHLYQKFQKLEPLRSHGRQNEFFECFFNFSCDFNRKTTKI